jgi:hypothetical protein
LVKAYGTSWGVNWELDEKPLGTWWELDEKPLGTWWETLGNSMVTTWVYIQYILKGILHRIYIIPSTQNMCRKCQGGKIKLGGGGVGGQGKGQTEGKKEVQQ